MDEKLEQKLITSYPNLFRGKDKPATQSLMCFGCECSDGWFDLINAACRVVQNYMSSTPECPPVEFVQIKEKFGGLRLYYDGGDEYVSGVFTMAEAMSYYICEITGDRGNLCSAGIWLRTLSPAMAEKHNYKRIRRDEEEKTSETKTDE